MMFTDYLKVLPQYLLPTKLISHLFFVLTRSRVEAWKNPLIRWFIRAFNVDMSIAEKPRAEDYPDFNSFFTRALKPGARPIAAGDEVVSPVDGTISQAGIIQQGRIFQAKGHHYTLRQLLGNDEDADLFSDGVFATIYLSPRDYHRIHMPLSGTLSSMSFIPGKLFSVNAATTRRIPALFARNERVISIFDTAAGPMAMVKVGALNVSRIDTVWAGPVQSASGRPERRIYGADEVQLGKGEEMGRFNMGSTVILLFAKEQVHWHAELTENRTLRMGEAIANRV